MWLLLFDLMSLGWPSEAAKWQAGGGLRDKKQMELVLQQAYCIQSSKLHSQQANVTVAKFFFAAFTSVTHLS